MKRIFGFMLAAAMVAVASPVAAQTDLQPDRSEENTRRGTRGATFLQLGVDARAAALAGAVTADVRGIPAMYWNTAGIGHNEQGALGFSVNELYGDFDIRLGHGGAILPVGAGALGLSITYLTSGDIERTTTFFPAGDDPIAGETFTYTGVAASLHYGRMLTDRLALGGAVRYATEGIEGARATFVGVDLGTQFETGLYGTTIGASLTNIGTEGRFEGQALQVRLFEGIQTGQTAVEVMPLASEFAMPTMFRFSVATSVLGSATSLAGPNPTHNVTFLGDVSDGIATPLMGALALEYGFRELAFLRAGKRFYNESGADWGGSHGFGFGGGVRLPISNSRLMLDYAYQPWGDLDNVQVFSVEYNF